MADKNKISISTGLFPTNYPPLFRIDNKKGIVQKTLEAISQRSAYDFKEEYYPFNRLIYMVGNGSLDLEAPSYPQWRDRVSGKVSSCEHGEVIVQLSESNSGWCKTVRIKLLNLTFNREK
ncbi:MULTISPECIES: hypothetical protein [unclassified Endozoicomonas]|uniref:hypothetical protein n=1 Tax=unclassified Endozoicomonas TaxID=2644528 RepID=UPI002148AACD|nr:MULTISPECIES: hypothetical protein [unclassified Endozoicomonas]